MRIRTGYSFKAAVGHLPEVADRLLEIGWTDGPITDRMSTFGYVNWTSECKRKGLRPVYGVELPVVVRTGDKKAPLDWWTFFATDRMRELNEAVEMATTPVNGSSVGLTYAQAEALPGLIKVTGERVLLDQLSRSPKDVFISLSPSTPRGVYNEARRRGIPLVATGDNLYTREVDKEFYRVAMGYRASTQSYPQHILDDGELQRSLHYVDNIAFRLALATRRKLLSRCTAVLGRATLLHPKAGKSLRDLCEEGAVRTHTDLAVPEYAYRLEKELRLIEEKNFEDYFFIIADLMQWSRQRMVVGPARGSSCGSLVCYLLGITSIDPIPHKLIFERFIDTTRADLPDIDLDFSDTNRHLALDYLSGKYGQEHTSRLGSVGMFQAKSSLNAIGAALKIPLWQINEVGNTIIVRSFGDARSSKTMLDTLQDTDVGKRLIEQYPNAILGARLEDHPSASGQHAAGMVLTQERVVDYVAVDGRTGACMCDKYDAEALNLLKIDMLGLTQLSVFERTLEMIGEEPRNGFLEALPLDDQLAFDQLNDLRFAGIFQFQYPGSMMQTLTVRLRKVIKGKIDKLEDIVALTALVRPGPLGSGATDAWMRRRAGVEEVSYFHPLFEPYLRDTLGIVAFQEQVMQIGREIGGLSWEDVTLLRKAMSRSLGKEYFDQFGDRWKAGASKKLGMSVRELGQFWDDLCQFGQWAFNRSHSVAYSVVTYWSCWLKAHHPVEFAAATLDAEGDPEKQIVVLKEMREVGVNYVALDRDHSVDRWAVKKEGGRKVLVGPLTNINGVGPVAVRNIMDARRKGTPLTPALAKKLENAHTSIASLSPIADAIKRVCPDLLARGIETTPTAINDIVGADQYVVILARVSKIAPLDENEPQRVARRKGKTYPAPTAALNMFFSDDSGEMFCKVDRFLFAEIGRELVAEAKKGKSLYAVGGLVPRDFRMIRVENIRYLGEYGAEIPLATATSSG